MSSFHHMSPCHLVTPSHLMTWCHYTSSSWVHHMSSCHCMPSSHLMSWCHYTSSSWIHHMSSCHLMPSSHRMSWCHYTSTSWLHHVSSCHLKQSSHHMSWCHYTAPGLLTWSMAPASRMKEHECNQHDPDNNERGEMWDRIIINRYLQRSVFMCPPLLKKSIFALSWGPRMTRSKIRPPPRGGFLKMLGVLGWESGSAAPLSNAVFSCVPRY